jgi:hypothetical protein
MTKKYLVIPGPMSSQYDNDIHYISFSQLCRLYGVNPAECVDGSRESQMLGRDTSNLIVLRPLYSGKYDSVRKNKSTP